MYYSARNLFGRKVNFGNVVSETVGTRQLIRAIAYVVSTEGKEESPFFEALNKAGIQTKEKQLMEYMSGIKKADWDVGITVDAMSIVDSVDVIVLVSGDGDFVPLAQYVKSHGRRFEVASFRETTASSLLEWADSYTNLSDDKRKYLIGKARLPAARMTKGGEAFVEKDQEEFLPDDMPKKNAVRAPVVNLDPDSRERRLSF
jgi:uncharacterized LabA/DUF88 family protein